MKAGAVAVIIVLGWSARAADAQHEHHHGSGPPPGHGLVEKLDRHVEAGVALEGALLADGSFEGVAPTVAWTRDWFGLRLVVPAYHLEHGGETATGLGDLTVAVHVDAFARDHVAAGAAFAVGLPTGDAARGLGMGHAMLMPSLWTSVRRGRSVLLVTVGTGKSFRAPAEHEHEHEHHGAVAGSLVSPMNAFELGGSLQAALELTPTTALQASSGIAVPIGDGVSRATAGAGARWRRSALDVGVALHLPIAGDPFRVRLVADVACRF